MGMRRNNIQMTTEVKKDELLEILKKNLAKHKEIVVEAKEGYIKKAREVLNEKLQLLENGELDELSVHLSAPEDYSDVYENSILMLEMHVQGTVVLEADEFNQLVRDQWDWSNAFLASNTMYSETASRAFKAKKRK